MIFGTLDLTRSAAAAADGSLDVFARCAPLVVLDSGTLEEADVYECLRSLRRKARIIVWSRNGRSTPAAYLRAGAEQLIVDAASASEYLNALPAERILVALDANRPGVLQTAGEFEERCLGLVLENCAPDSPLLHAARRICSGRIAAAPQAIDSASALDTAAALDREGVDVLVPAGSSALDPIAYLVRIADFQKGRGLLPTIVCDAGDGGVRMFAYSNPQSMALALAEGKGVYWSRSRRAIWRKGESSGRVQRLIGISLDCDRDTAVFYVEQSGPTCHTGDARCFGVEPFSWNQLGRRIEARAANGGAASYTKRLLSDHELLHGKIVEEAAEVCAARSAHDVAWECADLLYFLSVKMRSANVSINDVMAQLTARVRA